MVLLHRAARTSHHPLAELAPGTLYAPHATSLRMGPLGYQSDAQASLCVSYNSLKSYTASLYDALTQPYPAYEKIGLMAPGNGDDYRQLSTALLQIENEFYGTIRPKRRIRRGERPLHALRERGVEYVEVRLMDLDPFNPVGINAQTMRFLDMLLLYCLLAESPPGDVPLPSRADFRFDRRRSLREKYLGAVANRTAVARWFRHRHGARPTAVLLHGYMGGSFPLEERLSGAWLWVAEALPLLHPVRLVRAAFRGEASWILLWDLAYIALVSAALLWVAARVTRRRLLG